MVILMKLGRFHINSLFVYRLMKAAGLPVKYFRFSGDCKGRADGFPYKDGTYNTVANGELDEFYRGAKKVGDWVRVFKSYSQGDAATPDYYYAIYTTNPNRYYHLLNEIEWALEKAYNLAEIKQNEDWGWYEGEGFIEWAGERISVLYRSFDRYEVNVEYVYL